MKLIFFNTADATIDRGGIIDFIKSHKATTDIFCFQDAFEDSKELFQKLLPEYKKAAIYKYVSEPDYFRPATLIKPELDFKTIETLTEDKNTLGAGLYTEIDTNKHKSIHLLNFHGRSRPVEKLDSPERLEQAKVIIESFQSLKGTKILGGDFNLSPNIQSVKTIENAGYTNLISKFGIKSTRNEVIWKRFPNNKQYFSDYVFVNPETKVLNFEVPYSEISDHLPMIMEIEI